jgi:hypothetical protein
VSVGLDDTVVTVVVVVFVVVAAAVVRRHCPSAIKLAVALGELLNAGVQHVARSS